MSDKSYFNIVMKFACTYVLKAINVYDINVYINSPPLLPHIGVIESSQHWFR